MTHDTHGLSRRTVLATLGAAGLASAAGFASTAFFADDEDVAGTLAAGAVELRADFAATRGVVGGPATTVRSMPDPRPTPGADDPETLCATPGLIDGDQYPDTTLSDLVPGERGSLGSCVYVCGNPVVLWVRACVTDDDEVTYDSAREGGAGDETPDAGELGDAVRATLFVVDETDTRTTVYEGTLAGLSAFACGGVPLGPPGVSGDDAVALPDDCVGIGKLNVTDDGASFDGELEPGTAVDPDSPFTEPPWYDAGADRYVFETADGETVRVRIDGVERKSDEPEILAARLTVETPGAGVCRADVKSAGAPGPGSTSSTEYPDCPTSVRVETPVENRAISHVSLFVCAGDDPTPPDPVCSEPGRYCFGVDWHLPRDAGVEVSTDTVTLDLAVGGTQCRHDTDPAGSNPFVRLDREDGGDL
jgi:DNA-directed RNA polymerase subunit E'/Rpb7